MLAELEEETRGALQAEVEAWRAELEERAKKAPYVPNPAYHARGVKGAQATNAKRAADKARAGSRARESMPPPLRAVPARDRVKRAGQRRALPQVGELPEDWRRLQRARPRRREL